MIEEFEYSGVWWLPSESERRIPGTVSYNPNEGAILDLIGSLKDVRDLKKTLEPEIILGISSTGKKITLYRCMESRSTLSVPGWLTTSVQASAILVGGHFEKDEDVRFSEVSFYYSHLDEWANVSGFDLQFSPEEKRVVIRYKLPDSIRVRIEEDCEISMGFHSTGPARSIVQKEAHIKQRTFMRIKPAEGKSLDEYLSISYHLQNFLSLATMRPVYPMAIEGVPQLDGETTQGKDGHSTMTIHYRLPETPKSPKTLLPLDMLFTFSDISTRFEYFLNNWFKKADLLEPIYDLYFGTMYNPRMYLQHRFLSLVQAVESYHRRIMRNQELPQEKHDKRIEQILNRVPEEYEQWLRGKLRYSNEPTLRRRLKEVLGDFLEIVDFIEDETKFIQKVVVTRNYLTHYDASLKRQIARFEELYRITQKLRILLELSLLRELGFDSGEIKSLLSRARRFEHELRKG